MNTTTLTPATRSQAVVALQSLRGFIGRSQIFAISSGFRSEEKQFFFDKVVEMAGIIATMPKTYEQDGKGDQAIVYLHYFTRGCDWHITEKDKESDQLQAFGQADLGYGPELGYIPIVELLQCGAELDLHFTPRTLAMVNA